MNERSEWLRAIVERTPTGTLHAIVYRVTRPTMRMDPVAELEAPTLDVMLSRLEADHPSASVLLCDDDGQPMTAPGSFRVH